MEQQNANGASQTTLAEEASELVAESMLFVTRLFNSMVTEGKSREEDFPKERLPSVLFPQFAASLDVVPLMYKKFFSIPTADNENVVEAYMRIIAISMAMGAQESFAPYRPSLEFGFGFGNDRLEEQAVTALLKSSVVRGLEIPHKMVKSSFSPYARPKADDPKRDMELQLALRLFLYTTARWYGANQEQAMQIYNQHLKVSWVHVMCGKWEKAIELLKKSR